MRDAFLFSGLINFFFCAIILLYMPETKDKNKDFNLSLEEMAQAGLHFGHKVSAINPKMKPYISSARNSVHIIDLEKTLEKLKEALGFIQKIASENKILLLVGTNVQIKDMIKKVALACNLPYVNERWLGGTFTNFGTFKKRMEYFKSLQKRKEAGDLKKYTKKERAEIEKELQRLEIKFGGIKELEKLPDAVFVCNLKKDKTAIREARKRGVPIVAITNTNNDPTVIDYPIPANNEAMSSVKYILEKVKEAVLNNKPPMTNSP